MPANEREGDGPSRSAKKRESAAIQKLGEELAKLKPDEREGIGLSADLLEALAMSDKIRDREAARRQRQYIGKLMRGEDIAAISAALSARKNAGAEEIKLFRRAEDWRDKLLAADEASLPALLAQLRAESLGEEKYLAKIVEDARRAQSEADAVAASRNLFRDLSRLLKS
ncbi:MAG: DUF615 domain-containing protein [Desulfovibrio sp.]|nr:DUF615 domain-containing protein [Desulfovibrio sp.]